MSENLPVVQQIPPICRSARLLIVPLLGPGAPVQFQPGTGALKGVEHGLRRTAAVSKTSRSAPSLTLASRVPNTSTSTRLLRLVFDTAAVRRKGCPTLL